MIDDLLKILNPLINSKSVWKSHALYLVAEYYFAKNENRIEADLVNLGFVVNVIEDIEERIEALEVAYSLAKKLLVMFFLLMRQEKNLLIFSPRLKNLSKKT